MASGLPPVGSGYSGRSAPSGRFVSKSTAKKSPKTTITGKSSKTPPKGSAGVSRAK